MLLFLATTVPLAGAQANRTSNQLLGPLEIHSSGGGGTNVQISSPRDQSSLSNHVTVVFCVKASLLPYCYTSVGNIGYSLDGDSIRSVNDFMNQTIVNHDGSDYATVWANVTLPDLALGAHNVTVYFGWQHDEGVKRYEVTAYQTVNFTVAEPTPSPSVPEFPVAALLVAFLGVAALVLVTGRRLKPRFPT